MSEVASPSLAHSSAKTATRPDSSNPGSGEVKLDLSKLRLTAGDLAQHDDRFREIQGKSADQIRQLLVMKDRDDLAALVPSDTKFTSGASLSLCLELGFISPKGVASNLQTQIQDRINSMVKAIESSNWKELCKLIEADILEYKNSNSANNGSAIKIAIHNTATVRVFAALAALSNLSVKEQGAAQLSSSNAESIGVTRFLQQIDSVAACYKDKHVGLISAKLGLEKLIADLGIDHTSFKSLSSALDALNPKVEASRIYLERALAKDKVLNASDTPSSPSTTSDNLLGLIKYRVTKLTQAALGAAINASCISVGEAGRFTTSLFDFQKPDDGRTLFGWSVAAAGMIGVPIALKVFALTSRQTLKVHGYHKDWCAQLWQGFKATADEYADTFHVTAQRKLTMAIASHFRVPMGAFGDGAARTEAMSWITTLLTVGAWDDATPLDGDKKKDYSKLPNSVIGHEAWILSKTDIFHLEKLGALAGIRMRLVDPARKFYKVVEGDRSTLSANVQSKLKDLLNLKDGYLTGVREKAIKQLQEFALVTHFMGNASMGEYYMPWQAYCPGSWEDLKEFTTMDQNLIRSKWEDLEAKAAAGDQSAQNLINEMYQILGTSFAAKAREFSAADQPEWVKSYYRKDGAQRDYATKDEIIDALCSDPGNNVPPILREKTGRETIPKQVHEFMLRKAAAYLCFGVVHKLADEGIHPDLDAVAKLHLGGMGYDGTTPLADYENELRLAREENAKGILGAMTTGIGAHTNFGDYANPRRLADVALMFAILKCSEDAPPGRLEKFHLNIHQVHYYFQLYQNRLIQMTDAEFDSLTPFITRFSGLFMMADYNAQFGGAMSVWINTMSFEDGSNPKVDKSKKIKQAREEFIMYRLVQQHKRDGSGIDEAVQAELGGKRWRQLLREGRVSGLPGAQEFDEILASATRADGTLDARKFQKSIHEKLHDHLKKQPDEEAFERAISKRKGGYFLDPNTYMGRAIEELSLEGQFGYTSKDRAVATARFIAVLTGRGRVETRELNNAGGFSNGSSHKGLLVELEPMDPSRYVRIDLPDYVPQAGDVRDGTARLSRQAYQDGVMAIQAPAAVFAEISNERLLNLWKQLRFFAPPEKRREYDDLFLSNKPFSAIEAAKQMKAEIKDEDRGKNGVKKAQSPDWDPTDLQLTMVSWIGVKWNGKLDQFMSQVLDSEECQQGCSQVLHPKTTKELNTIANSLAKIQNASKRHKLARVELAKIFGDHKDDFDKLSDEFLITRTLCFKPIDRQERHTIKLPTK